MKLFFAKILSTCFGLGYFPVAPGTVTSFVVALGYFFLPVLHNPVLLLVLVLFSTGIGIWAGGVMEELFGNDPSIVTIDELVGQWLALVALPEGVWPVAFAFLFFRFFDIAKPGPVDALQRLPGGWGIMLDDVLAGLFANVSVRALIFLLTFFHLWPSL